MLSRRPLSSLSLLVVLTLLALLAQGLFFIIHFKAGQLLDSLVQNSLIKVAWALWLPSLIFIGEQLLAYALVVTYLYWLSVQGSHLVPFKAKSLALVGWLLAAGSVLILNSYFFPQSFYALPFKVSSMAVVGLSFGWSVLTLLGLKQSLGTRGRPSLSLALVLIGLLWFTQGPRPKSLPVSSGQPNVIIIGLDSLRPDFVLSPGSVSPMPHLLAWLQTSQNYAQASTPLARTYPSWISILTAKHPKNSQARINLIQPQAIARQDNLAKVLQRAGYQTIYATDDKRFSNITSAYGFDQIVGPKMGLSDFIIGGLADFPLTNLLLKLPLAQDLFPYNYANRAAAITYDPEQFSQLLKDNLAHRTQQPLFLAVHFCLSHWPYTWAGQGSENLSLAAKYRLSLARLDQQLAQFLQLLKSQGLLAHTVVVILSDHGTTLGLAHDRSIERQHYLGPKSRLRMVGASLIEATAERREYSISTSYGQGTDILSLKQNQVLLAIKGYGLALPVGVKSERVSLLDLAPTLLGILKLPPLQGVDGIDLALNPAAHLRPFYFETGYSLTEIEKAKINPEQVLKKAMGLYQVDKDTSLISLKPSLLPAILANKQRAVILGDWMLAHYPPRTQNRFVKRSGQLLNKRDQQPAYYVLMNLNTQAWTLGLDTELAKLAPLPALQQAFAKFYGEEVAAS